MKLFRTIIAGLFLVAATVWGVSELILSTLPPLAMGLALVVVMLAFITILDRLLRNL